MVTIHGLFIRLIPGAGLIMLPFNDQLYRRLIGN